MKKMTAIVLLNLGMTSGLVLMYSCGKTIKHNHQLKQESNTPDSLNTIPNENLNAPKETVIDTVTLDLDNDNIMEDIIITEGYYEMDQYKFEVYKNRNLIGTLYSQIK